MAMTATAGHPIAGNLVTGGTGMRRWRPDPRLSGALLAALGILLVLAFPEQARAVATATCTFGAPPGSTCGEALVLLGYP
jgi:hypothetical protein